MDYLVSGVHLMYMFYISFVSKLTCLKLVASVSKQLSLLLL